MDKFRIRPWKPWKGKKYSTARVLILGESAYSWFDKAGNEVPLSPSHPSIQLRLAIKNFPRQGYFSRTTRALCGEWRPTAEAMKEAWAECAYTIFVQGAVGVGAGKKATDRQFRESGFHFLRLLEKIRPLRVIVTGKKMWNLMPPAPAHIATICAKHISFRMVVWFGA
jgi:hypothetical protein